MFASCGQLKAVGGLQWDMDNLSDEENVLEDTVRSSPGVLPPPADVSSLVPEHAHSQ